ncbi:cofilin [Balamuthia mandrillaris]
MSLLSVTVPEELHDAYNNMKKGHHRFVLYRLEDSGQLVVEQPPPPPPSLRLATTALRQLEQRHARAGRTLRLKAGSEEGETEPLMGAFARLPPELVRHVLLLLETPSLVALSSTSSYWYEYVMGGPQLWQEVVSQERALHGGDLCCWGSTWETLLALLPKKEPRYAFFMWPISDADTANATKMVFLFWCPSEARIRQKMMCTSVVSELHRKLGGVLVQATELDELDYGGVNERVKLGF